MDCERQHARWQWLCARKRGIKLPALDAFLQLTLGNNMAFPGNEALRANRSLDPTVPVGPLAQGWGHRIRLAHGAVGSSWTAGMGGIPFARSKCLGKLPCEATTVARTGNIGLRRQDGRIAITSGSEPEQEGFHDRAHSVESHVFHVICRVCRSLPRSFLGRPNHLPLILPASLR